MAGQAADGRSRGRDCESDGLAADHANGGDSAGGPEGRGWESGDVSAGRPRVAASPVPPADRSTLGPNHGHRRRPGPGQGGFLRIHLLRRSAAVIRVGASSGHIRTACPPRTPSGPLMTCHSDGRQGQTPGVCGGVRPVVSGVPATERAGSRAVCLTIVFQLCESAAREWRSSNGAKLLPAVGGGVQFNDGE